MEPWQRLSDNARQAVVSARDLARSQGCNDVSAEHLVLGILAQKGCLARRILRERGVDIHGLRDDLMQAAARHTAGGPTPSELDLTPTARRAMQMASVEARKDAARHARTLGQDFFVSTVHLLLGLIHPASTADLRSLRTHGVFYGEVRELLRRTPPANGV